MPYAKLNIRSVYGTIAVTQAVGNTYPAAVAILDDNLPPPAVPQPVLGGDFNGYQRIGNFVTERANLMQLVGDHSLEAKVSGTYSVNIGWATFRHSHNNATVAFVLGIERDGIVTFSQRPTASRIANVDKLSNIAGGGTLELQAGDKLSVWVATDTAGTITIPNANVTCVGLHA